MSDVKYKYIIASDLDGTLLASGERISPENAEAIAEMKKRGICFVPNSGRALTEMPKAVLENPDIRYYIGSDGGVIWDKETGEKTEVCMSREEFGRLYDIISEYDTVDTVRYGGRSYADKNNSADEDFKRCGLDKDYGDFIVYYSELVDNYDEFVRSLPGVEMICTFFGNDRDRLECRQRIEALGIFKVASSAPANIEVFHKKAGKGNTLLALADKLGVPRENTIAVGDGFNDMDMIEKAGIGLAMDNACPELKEKADRVICRFEEHSARYILDNVIPE